MSFYLNLEMTDFTKTSTFYIEPSNAKGVYSKVSLSVYISYALVIACLKGVIYKLLKGHINKSCFSDYK